MTVPFTFCLQRLHSTYPSPSGFALRINTFTMHPTAKTNPQNSGTILTLAARHRSDQHVTETSDHTEWYTKGTAHFTISTGRPTHAQKINYVDKKKKKRSKIMVLSSTLQKHTQVLCLPLTYFFHPTQASAILYTTNVPFSLKINNIFHFIGSFKILSNVFQNAHPPPPQKKKKKKEQNAQ